MATWQSKGVLNVAGVLGAAFYNFGLEAGAATEPMLKEVEGVQDRLR